MRRRVNAAVRNDALGARRREVGRLTPLRHPLTPRIRNPRQDNHFLRADVVNSIALAPSARSRPRLIRAGDAPTQVYPSSIEGEAEI